LRFGIFVFFRKNVSAFDSSGFGSMFDGNLSASALLRDASSQAVYKALENVKVPGLERYAVLENDEIGLGSEGDEGPGQGDCLFNFRS
jgi:hypothetical protein